MSVHADVRTRRQKRTAEWPSFSIVIPTYERREVVCEAVRALGRLQYEGEVAVIVVIDGATDGTAEALSKIKLPFEMTVIEQSNRGAADARNSGAAIARNDVILFLDDDMIAEADLLEQHGRPYQDGADAVIGNMQIHSSSPRGFLRESVARWETVSRVRSPLSPFDIFSGQLSVRRAVFDDLGGFDTALTSGGAFGNEDAELGVRLLAKYDVRHNPSAMSRQVYVVGPGEFMKRARAAVAADLHFIAKHPQWARLLFDEKGVSRPLTRLVYLPLARIPLFPELLAKLAVKIADLALKTPFHSNRIVARLFSGARSVAYWSALCSNGWLPFGDRVLVLCYHAIADQSGDPVLAPYGVAPELFARQLDLLKRRGFTFISPAHLAAFLDAKAPLPRRPVLLTFDDGYADLLPVARDILQPRGIHSVAFVVTACGSGTNEWDQAFGAKTVRLLSAKERAEVVPLGIEIGSHSRTHRELPLLGEADMWSEVRGSAEDLAGSGLPQPRFFAYPFGAYSREALGAVKSAGYLAAFSTRQRHVRPGNDLHDIPRVMVYASDRGWRFRAKTAAPRLWALAERIRRRIAS